MINVPQMRELLKWLYYTNEENIKDFELDMYFKPILQPIYDTVLKADGSFDDDLLPTAMIELRQTIKKRYNLFDTLYGDGVLHHLPYPYTFLPATLPTILPLNMLLDILDTLNIDYNNKYDPRYVERMLGLYITKAGEAIREGLIPIKRIKAGLINVINYTDKKYHDLMHATVTPTVDDYHNTKLFLRYRKILTILKVDPNKYTKTRILRFMGTDLENIAIALKDGIPLPALIAKFHEHLFNLDEAFVHHMSTDQLYGNRSPRKVLGDHSISQPEFNRIYRSSGAYMGIVKRRTKYAGTGYFHNRVLFESNSSRRFKQSSASYNYRHIHSMKTSRPTIRRKDASDPNNYKYKNTKYTNDSLRDKTQQHLRYNLTEGQLGHGNEKPTPPSEIIEQIAQFKTTPLSKNKQHNIIKSLKITSHKTGKVEFIHFGRRVFDSVGYPLEHKTTNNNRQYIDVRDRSSKIHSDTNKQLRTITVTGRDSAGFLPHLQVHDIHGVAYEQVRCSEIFDMDVVVKIAARSDFIFSPGQKITHSNKNMYPGQPLMMVDTNVEVLDIYIEHVSNPLHEISGVQLSTTDNIYPMLLSDGVTVSFVNLTLRPVNWARMHTSSWHMTFASGAGGRGHVLCSGAYGGRDGYREYGYSYSHFVYDGRSETTGGFHYHKHKHGCCHRKTKRESDATVAVALINGYVGRQHDSDSSG